MSWNSRETAGEVTTLGNAEGHVASATGWLKAIRPGKYENMLYVVEAEDGSLGTYAGNKILDDMVNEGDVDKFIRIKFKGWEKSTTTGNDYKTWDVKVWDGEPTERMTKWGNGVPGKTAPNAPSSEEPPIGDAPDEFEEADDDDLPF